MSAIRKVVLRTPIDEAKERSTKRKRRTSGCSEGVIRWIIEEAVSKTRPIRKRTDANSHFDREDDLHPSFSNIGGNSLVDAGTPGGNREDDEWRSDVFASSDRGGRKKKEKEVCDGVSREFLPPDCRSPSKEEDWRSVLGLGIA